MLNLDTAENKMLSVKSSEAFSDANSLVVDSQDSYELAVDFIKTIKSVGEEVEKQRKLITEPMDKSKKAVMDFFRPFTERVESAEKALKDKCAQFLLAQKAKADAERAEAQRKAREEAEKARVAAEAAIDQGKIEEAGELMTAAEIIDATPVVIPNRRPVAAGASMRDKWEFEVTSIDELIAAAATNPMIRTLLQVNESAAKTMASQLKGNVQIPGIRFYNNPIMSVRR